MPIYEYACGNCEYELEEVQKFNDPVLVECPQCGKAELYRKISKSAFHLKGGGWYKDGYGLNAEKKNAAEDKKPKSEAATETTTTEKTSTEKSTATDSSNSPPAATPVSPATTSASTASSSSASSSLA